MKTRFAVILLSLVIPTSMANAQIDTTRKEFFPLHVGDLWQYRDQNNQLAIQRVTGDTILEGKRYFLLIHSLRTSGGGITRIDSLLRIQNRRGLPTGGDSCGGTTPYEVNIYRLGEPSSTIWKICDTFWGLPAPNPLVRFNGISTRTVFGQARDVMRFDFGGTAPTPNDTILGFGAYLARGIGVIHEQYYDSPFCTLQGAIINGVQYGTIVTAADIGQTLPAELKLEQNFPNPFNPSTTIKYDLPERAKVSLIVYDVLGRTVAELVNEEKAAGYYSVTWSATNVASGVYLARFTASDANGYSKFSKVNKLVLMK